MLPDLATSPILIQVSPINGKATRVFYHIPVDKQFNATINETYENSLTIKPVPV
jgi:citrate lyase gamma subunit